MKIYIYPIILFILTINTLSSCRSSADNADNSKNDSAQIANNTNQTGSETSVYNYNQVLKDQDSLSKDFGWPIKHVLDLNDDGISEEFQAIEGYSRGMGYALFSKENQNWKLISANESIASGHLGINKLDKTNKGWHDFVALQPSGREGIIESYYNWDGQKYILKEQKEVGY